MEDVIIPVNEYQTPITKTLLEQYPDEIQEQFLDFVDTVPMIKWMISENRPRAKDLPRDEKGRIIVDVTHPHILEDMDYFRPSAKFFQQNGCYTLLKPNPNPNSEFGKWFFEEVRRCRDGYVRESDGEWIPGRLYFFLNYSPIMLNRKSETSGVYLRVEDFPDFWEGIYYRYHYREQARLEGKHCMELARRGAHPYDEKVFTPEGWKTWGEITVGSRLFGADGKITTVTDIPFDSEAECYEITLRDGRKITASDDHLWIIREGHQQKLQTINTESLLKKYRKQRKVSERLPSGVEYNCFIEKNNGVDLPFVSVPIDAYTLGYILGDGCLRHRGQACNITVEECDAEHAIRKIPYPLKKFKSKYTYRILLQNAKLILSEYGLWGVKSEDKFIPDDYKYNNRAIRLAVLQGLFDTDAYVHGGVPHFVTVSKRLSNDVMEVARSLGYNAFCSVQESGYKKDGVYRRCLDSYHVSVYAGPEIFDLPRKKSKVHYDNGYQCSRRDRTSIIDIKPIGVQKCKCVTVDASDACYLIGDFVTTHNCAKSFTLASDMNHNLLLGENSENTRRVTTILTAYLKEYLSSKDGTLSKFTPMVDFCAEHTEFPRLMVKRSQSEMIWQMGYKNPNGNVKGSLNSVMAVSIKDDEGKVRGKRGFVLFEEMGSYKNFKEVWDNVRDSVKEGSHVFAQLIAVGTAGDSESDFSGIKTMLYNPDAYEIYALDNVYDQKGKGTQKFAYFFPSYISRAGCMDSDGNSDVVKALLEILKERWIVKQGGDAGSLLSRIAQMPITPAEAILKVKSNYFPVVMLNERLRQLDTDPRAFDDVYVGTLLETSTGEVVFRPTDDVPIRKWPVDNTEQGAIEIFTMPQSGTIPSHRYIIGHDPVDNDQAESSSLSSTFVFDMFTDEIVAEYTGRRPFAEDNYEIVYLLAKFYNASILYEANRKGLYQYFAKKHCTWMLADCPEYLRDRQLVKYSMFGSAQKGVTVNAAIIGYANDLIRDWLLKTYPAEIKDERGEVTVQQIPQLYKIRNKALLQELVSYSPEVNVDRVRALSQVMLYREHFMVLYGGSPDDSSNNQKDDADDDWFNVDWERHRTKFYGTK